MPPYNDKDREGFAYAALTEGVAQIASKADVTARTVQKWIREHCKQGSAQKLLDIPEDLLNSIDLQAQDVGYIPANQDPAGAVRMSIYDADIPNPFTGRVPDNVWDGSWNRFRFTEHQLFGEYPEWSTYAPHKEQSRLDEAANELHEWCDDCCGRNWEKCDDYSDMHGTIQEWIDSQHTVDEMLKKHGIDCAQDEIHIILTDPQHANPYSDSISEEEWESTWFPYVELTGELFGTYPYAEHYDTILQEHNVHVDPDLPQFHLDNDNVDEVLEHLHNECEHCARDDHQLCEDPDDLHQSVTEWKTALDCVRGLFNENEALAVA